VQINNKHGLSQQNSYRSGSRPKVEIDLKRFDNTRHRAFLEKTDPISFNAHRKALRDTVDRQRFDSLPLHKKVGEVLGNMVNKIKGLWPKEKPYQPRQVDMDFPPSIDS
jgi:hypothetical protein